LHDTDVDNDEVQDLEADTKMPPKKSSTPKTGKKTPKKGAAKEASV
jgi:hypothetical protein